MLALLLSAVLLNPVDELDSLNDQLKDLEFKLLIQERLLSDAETLLARENLKKVTAQADRIAKQVELAKELAKPPAERNQGRIAILQSQISALDQQISISEGLIANYKLAISNYKKRIKDLKAKIAVIKAAIAALS